jgi:hypothetical protein
MLSRFQHWVCSGVLLAFLAGSQTGCQSWKTPSFNMFPWSKKPSPDKIVGTKPPSTLPSSPSTSGSTMLAQDTSKSGGPISPASRNTPSSIPGTPTGASSSSVAMPSPGAAAANNGFTPGTYNVPQNRGPAGAPNPYAANPYAANPYAAAPNSIPQPATMPPGANPYAMAQAPGNINPYGSSLPTTTGNPVSPASMAVPPMSAPPMNASFNATPSQPGPNFQNNIPNLPVAYGGPGLPPPGQRRRCHRVRSHRWLCRQALVRKSQSHNFQADNPLFRRELARKDQDLSGECLRVQYPLLGCLLDLALHIDPVA